jgi:predicted membrane channel-forming protein YqfA (hemolysin III family)
MLMLFLALIVLVIGILLCFAPDARLARAGRFVAFVGLVLLVVWAILALTSSDAEGATFAARHWS